MSINHYKAMSRYNQWMNEKIYDICSNLSDDIRKQNRNAFFKSIHGTLNHLLLADIIWTSRFKKETYKVKSLDIELYSDFIELKNKRIELDLEIIVLIDSYKEGDLEKNLQYIGVTDPTKRQYSLWFALSHFFNHQTHHRGQITTLLSQMDIDPGITDLIRLPTHLLD